MIITKGGFERVNFWALKHELMLALYQFSNLLEKDIVICVHAGVEGVHNEKGYHPLGLAVDLHLERDGEVISYQEQYSLALKYWRGGIGVYPFWKSPGLHLDVGPDDRLWWRDQAGNYENIKSLPL